MDKLFITILIVLVLLYLINKNNKKPIKETFASMFPSQWTNLSKKRCSELDEQMEDPQYLMNQSCNPPDTMKERDAINSEMTCLNNVNRQIFNDREKKSWCASAKNVASEDVGFYAAQSANTYTNDPGLISEYTSEQIQLDGETTMTKTNKAGCINTDASSAFNYNLISGGGFMPTSYEKGFSGVAASV